MLITIIVISGNGILQGYYAASSGNSLAIFRDNIFLFLNPEDGTDRFSWNVGREIPLLAV